jgi:hypothetical protein
MSTSRGRCYWDAARWLEYGERLHRVMGHVDHVNRMLPPTPGWKARDCDILLKVRNSVELALVAMERVIPEHFGGRWEDVPAPVREFPQHWFPAREFPPREFTTLSWNERAHPRSREEWIVFGDAVKESFEILQQSFCVFSNECRGRDRKPHLAALAKANRWIDKAKCRLDSLVFEQHRDWKEATRVFYGPRMSSRSPS